MRLPSLIIIRVYNILLKYLVNNLFLLKKLTNTSSVLKYMS